MTATQLALIPKVIPKKRRESIPLRDLPDEYIGERPGRDLIDSVKVNGVIEPIVVRTKGGGYVLVEGRRRVAAQRKARAELLQEFGTGSPEAEALDEIEAIVLDGAEVSPAMASALTISLHATRRDNVAMELEAIEDLMRRGAGEHEIIEATGLSAQEIRARLKLQRLIPPMRAAFRAGKIPASTAEDAARLPPAAQARLAAKLTAGERVTGKDVRAARSAQAAEATAQLPDDIFAHVPEETESSADTVALVSIADFVQSRTEGEWRRLLSEDAVALLEELADLIPEGLRPAL